MKVLQFILSAVVGMSLIGVAISQNSNSTSQSQSKNGSSSSSASSSAQAGASSSQGGSFHGQGNGSGSTHGLPKPTHAIMFSQTDSWSQHAYDGIRASRTAYFAHLQQIGKLLYFGVWRDMPGQMSIVVATDAEAKQIADNDPAVSAGLLSADVRAWTVQVDPFSAVAASR